MTITLQLPPKAEERIESLVAKYGRTKEFYLEELIERGLEDIEDYYVAVDVLERVRRGEEPVHKAQEVWDRLGLDA